MPDDPLLDKVPPHSIEAEMSVLGAMMLNDEALGACIQILDSEECFYRREHRILFKLLIQFFEDNHAVDFVTFSQKLRDKGQLDEIGGQSYLVTLVESVPTVANAEYYARIVKEKALLRAMVAAAGEIVRDAHAQGQNVDEVLDRCEQRIFEITERKIVGQAQDVRTILSQVIQTLDFQGGHSVTGLDTGYYELNEMTRGFQPGELIILAARPSVGKSALALNFAEHIAVDQNQPVAFFSLEMSREELALRLLSSRARVDGQKLRKGQLSTPEVRKIMEVADYLYKAPLYIDDTPALRVLDLRAKARRLMARHGIKLIICDYLQLMSSPGAESRQVEVSTISRGLKALGRELRIPILAVAQLRRESEEHNQPRLSDLRESGALEQDADVVMLIHREEMRHPLGTPEREEHRGKAELIIAKQRNGPTGLLKLTWLRQYARFEPSSDREQTPDTSTADVEEPPAEGYRGGPGETEGYRSVPTAASEDDAEPPF
jgi:replicative DNA helicase